MLGGFPPWLYVALTTSQVLGGNVKLVDIAPRPLGIRVPPDVSSTSDLQMNGTRVTSAWHVRSSLF
jgi:hypothetical protein